MSKPVEISTLKIGQYILINSEPCRIVEYERSKPGKHGSMKARIVGIGIFDSVKRNLVSPVDARVDVPLIEKRSAQIISTTQDQLQLMDLETFDIFYAAMPKDENLKRKLGSGHEVEYWRVMDSIMIMRVK